MARLRLLAAARAPRPRPARLRRRRRRRAGSIPSYSGAHDETRARRNDPAARRGRARRDLVRRVELLDVDHEQPDRLGNGVRDPGADRPVRALPCRCPRSGPTRRLRRPVDADLAREGRPRALREGRAEAGSRARADAREAGLRRRPVGLEPVPVRVRGEHLRRLPGLRHDRRRLQQLAPGVRQDAARPRAEGAAAEARACSSRASSQNAQPRQPGSATRRWRGSASKRRAALRGRCRRARAEGRARAARKGREGADRRAQPDDDLADRRRPGRLLAVHAARPLHADAGADAVLRRDVGARPDPVLPAGDDELPGIGADADGDPRLARAGRQLEGPGALAADLRADRVPRRARRRLHAGRGGRRGQEGGSGGARTRGPEVPELRRRGRQDRGRARRGPQGADRPAAASIRIMGTRFVTDELLLQTSSSTRTSAPPRGRARCPPPSISPRRSAVSSRRR